MTISNSTIEIINFTKDLDYDYNIKFILLTMIIVTSIALILFAKRMNTETHRQELTKLFLTTLGGIGIFNIFMYPFILKREFSIDFITNIIFSVYTVLVTIIGMFILWYLAELFLTKYFGVSFKSNNNKIRSERDYR